MLFFANVYFLKASKAENFSLTGYIDTYFTTDNLDEEFTLFSSINHQREIISLNIAYLLMQFNQENYRFKLGLQEGDIPKNIYFEEPKNIQQANIGIRLAEDLWLDGGVLSTHIGGEMTHPRMNFFSSHSAVTFFEPTYQTGFKLSYIINKNWSSELQIINGNHLIGDNNEQKTIALSVNYENERFNAFYSGMAGNEEPTHKEKRLHTYHNLFLSWKISENLELKAQKDIATIATPKAIQESSGKTLAWFYGGFVQSRYKFNEKFSSSARYSFYSDVEGTYNLNVEGYDISLVAEYKPVSNSYLRIESRFLKNTFGKNENSFKRDGKDVNELIELSLNFGLWFDLKI